MKVELVWGWSAFARKLIVLAALALACALALARPALIVVATAPIAWLALARGQREPHTATVRISHPERSFEQEPIAIAVRVELADAVDSLHVEFAPARGFEHSEPVRAVTVSGAAQAQLSADVSAPRWGRHPIGEVSVRVWARRRLRHAHLVVHAQTDVAVFPRPAPLAALPFGSTRYDRVGDHAASSAGAGVEFHGVRRFAMGDKPRRVNWSVSTRRGELYVNDLRAERAVDVVVAIDVLTDTGPAGNSSRDLALRGAVGIARTVLSSHDRVGLVAVGGRLRWLAPDLGDRQFYRVAEAMLDVIGWQSFIDPDVDTIPYPALPAGAHVVFFSPLVDERGIEAVLTLRRRGHPVTVIDVCQGEPHERGASAQLALRLWRLERAATRNRFADMGIVVAGWDGTAALDALITPVVRATERMGR